MRVAQVNVRLSEGGAASVARTIADGLGPLDRHGAFIYGYGPKGKRSPLEDAYRGVQMTGPVLAKAHQALHAASGLLIPGATLGQRLRLARTLEGIDIVHLHAIHSYWISPEWLVRELLAQNKKIVWTMHDHWLLTGRCAQPGACDRWQAGCGSCPDLRAYPPSAIDRSAGQWRSRRRLLEELQQHPSVALVSCAKWLAEEAANAGIDNMRVIPNSIDPKMWNLLGRPGAQNRTSGSASGPRVLFMSRDLRDAAKVDWHILSAISDAPGVSLTVVGDHGPPASDSMRRIPAIVDRTQILRELQSADRLVFTSRVDYHPLTVIEALSAGTEVYALESPAVLDLAGTPGLHTFATARALVAAVTSDRVAGTTRLSVGAHARGIYQPEKMVAAYESVYIELMEQP